MHRETSMRSVGLLLKVLLVIVSLGHLPKVIASTTLRAPESSLFLAQATPPRPAFYRASAVQLVPCYTVWLGGTPQETVNKSIQDLALAVKLAISRDAADIVVLPEGGTGYFEANIHNGTVASLTPYCEEAVPIGSAPTQEDSPQQYAIATAAASNGTGAIVVLNFCEKELVVSGVRAWRHYDTSIVFSSNGTVISKYRKWNLFSGDFLFNRTKVAEPTFFDTQWGRFGFFVCFDLTFRDPSAVLIQKYGIKNILFSTDWINSIGSTATIMQRGFAMRYGVNLIASNDATCPDHCGGGVYSGSRVLNVYFNPNQTFAPQIVSAKVPTNISGQWNPPPVRGPLPTLHKPVVHHGGEKLIPWVQKDCGHGPRSCAIFKPTQPGKGWVQSLVETQGNTTTTTTCTATFTVKEVKNTTSIATPRGEGEGEKEEDEAPSWTLEAFHFDGCIPHSPSIVNRTSCRLRRCGQLNPRFPEEPCPLLHSRGHDVVTGPSNVVFDHINILAQGHGFAANTSSVFPEFAANTADVSEESGLIGNLTYSVDEGGAYLMQLRLVDGKMPTLFGASLNGQMSPFN